jgi:hypothetical protein
MRGYCRGEAMRKIPLKARLRGVRAMFGTAVAELAAILLGFIRFDTPEGDSSWQYVYIPGWILLVTPVIVGLYVFFRVWHGEVESGRTNNRL